MHSALLNIFGSITEINTEDEKMIRELFKPFKLNKNEFFLETNAHNDRIAFIGKGLVRYFVYKKDEESTLEFTKEGEFIAEYQSFTNRQKAIQSIQAIEDCELLVISYDDLQRIFKETKCGNILGRVVVEHRFNIMINQLLSLYMHSSEERYNYFVTHYSDLVQRIPQYLIASYVGVKPQSLSRIRKRLAKGHLLT
jgi:CRP-like cAMP-binding protein